MTMRIAVFVGNDQGLDAPIISSHFGRCLPILWLWRLALVEIEKVETVVNPYHPDHEPGQVLSFIQSLNASVMLSGGMGGRAVALFRQYGIEPATGAFWNGARGCGAVPQRRSGWRRPVDSAAAPLTGDRYVSSRHRVVPDGW